MLEIRLTAENPKSLLLTLRELIGAFESAVAATPDKDQLALPLGAAATVTPLVQPTESAPPSGGESPPSAGEPQAAGKGRRGPRKPKPEPATVPVVQGSDPAPVTAVLPGDPPATAEPAPAAPAAPVEPTAAPLPQPLNRDIIKAVGNRYMAKHGIPATLALLAKYGATKLSELAEEHYEAVYAELTAGAGIAA